MSAPTSGAVRTFVVDALSEQLAEAGLEPAGVPDDLDLLDAGVIDSFGILELIGEVEERFAIEIDFDELDPEGMTVLGTFAAFVADQAAAQA